MKNILVIQQVRKIYTNLLEWSKPVKENDCIYGENVEIFSKYQNIEELIKSKVHTTKQSIKGKKDMPSESVFLNSSIHQDFGKVIIFDATFENKEGITSLIKNSQMKYPIRVIRGQELKSEYRPSIFDQIRYDGLYWVTSIWKEKKGEDIFMKIRFVRFIGLPIIPKLSFEIKKDDAESVKVDPNVIKKYSLFSKQKEEEKMNTVVRNPINKDTTQVITKKNIEKPKSKPEKKQTEIKKTVVNKKQTIETNKTMKKDEKKPIEQKTQKIEKSSTIKSQNTEKKVLNKPQPVSQTKQIEKQHIKETPKQMNKTGTQSLKRKYIEEDPDDKYDSDFIDDSEVNEDKEKVSEEIKKLIPTGRNLVIRKGYEDDDDIDIEEVNDIAVLDEEEERSLKLAKKEDKLLAEMDEKRRKERQERLSKKKK